MQVEFPGVKGWSARNLWRMLNFYSTYKDKPKLTPLVAEIGWSHNLIIMEKCKNDNEKEFYIKMSQKMGWSKYILRDKIQSKEYLPTQVEIERRLEKLIR